MHSKRWLLICSLFVALIPFVGCKSKPINPNQGFTITTSIETENSVGGPGPLAPLPGTLVLGQVVPGTAGNPPQGTEGSYSAHTSLVTDTNGNKSAQYYVSDGIAPADWNHYVWLPTSCVTPNPPVQTVNSMPGFQNEFGVLSYQTNNLGSYDWTCGQNFASMPEADSRFAIAGSVPASVTLSGQQPFSTQYGLPIMYAFTGAGAAPKLAATVTASSVNSGGTTATFPLGNSFAQGGYFFVTENANSTGGYDFNSWNLYTIAGSQTISGSPFGVSVGTQTHIIEPCIWVPTPPHGGHYQCSTNTTNSPVPVVSLYSSAQVLVNGTTVNVGTNPTAVATYPGGSVSTTTYNGSGYITNTVAGFTRALVANSGGNTVSVVDTVNNVPVATISVGNNPVGLAVSSDGSSGYVANYTDSTVTKVNLTNNTSVTTVTVGGKPTSLTLTSGGTLWVGGAGFLTQINTSNMSVIGTETVVNRNVLSLSYSDTLGQLIVESADPNGSVYQDEMDPASFSAGATYKAIASRAISTLGSYTVRAEVVRAFTSTLSNSGSLPTNLAGSPPLVVQDGWAVVAATPTGFTITDISGHVVLVSETTSSPIAAIAVDTNLNIAYLTEPDSNTILTVPLPGTGTN